MRIKDTNYIDNGFFKYCINQLSFIDESNASTLDNEWFYGHSYYKRTSLFFDNMLEIDENTAFTKCYDSILLRFKAKWERLYKAMIQSDYNPTDVYSIKEKENIGTKVTTETNNDNNVYGFNSDTSVNVSDNKTTSEVASNKMDNEREASKTGNNGVHTFAELIDDEINYQDRWNFYQIVYKDIDTILCSMYID